MVCNTALIHYAVDTREEDYTRAEDCLKQARRGLTNRKTRYASNMPASLSFQGFIQKQK